MLKELSEHETNDIKLRAGMLEGRLDRGLKSRNLDEDVRLREQEQILRARGLDQDADQIAARRDALAEETRHNRATEATGRTAAEADMIRAKAYPRMGGYKARPRPETRIPVNQYDDARMMAIEELMASDPNAQYYFQAEEKGGQPTGNYYPVMKRSRMLGLGSRDLNEGERRAMAVYMDKIQKRAQELAGQS